MVSQRDLIKDNEDINVKDDLKESHIVKHEDKMKLKSILLFSMTPQSTTTSLPVLSIEITTTIPKQVTFSSLIKQKSEPSISETSITIKKPSTVVIRSTTTEEPSTVTVKSTITEESSEVRDKSTSTKSSSSMSPSVLSPTSTVTSSVSNKSEFKLSKTRPESSTVFKTESCKKGSSECVIDIPVTAIPKSLDIIYE
ncbi:hypothetical protein NBO_404g0002 [Nosema bombycis CQ1]|uniref:Uncharacterized protein n=1 Tax=Nosema bombycis (strain CQ1 / CVCC 102059) TaxID=578461 RepID=R0M3H9_NOSB1|nr:hypothetical protein NBO_404g0002 [Nosema bombycis CQ1]|eukprot:EOB12574.1 hypothetical protein NBO_404g0002 [Nosema bombycis CQ1]